MGGGRFHHMMNYIARILGGLRGGALIPYELFSRVSGKSASSQKHVCVRSVIALLPVSIPRLRPRPRPLEGLHCREESFVRKQNRVYRIAGGCTGLLKCATPPHMAPPCFDEHSKNYCAARKVWRTLFLVKTRETEDTYECAPPAPPRILQT